MSNRVIHLIEFMLIINDFRTVNSAILLASKLNKQEFLMPFIMKALDKSTEIDNKMIDNISLILNSFPEVAKDRIPKLLALLDRFLTIYKEEEEKKMILNKIETNFLI